MSTLRPNTVTLKFEELDHNYQLRSGTQNSSCSPQSEATITDGFWRHCQLGARLAIRSESKILPVSKNKVNTNLSVTFFKLPV